MLTIPIKSRTLYILDSEFCTPRDDIHTIHVLHLASDYSRHHIVCLTYGTVLRWTQFSYYCLDSLIAFCVLYAKTYGTLSRWTRFSDCCLDSSISSIGSRMPRPMAHYLVGPISDRFLDSSISFIYFLYSLAHVPLLFGRMILWLANPIYSVSWLPQ
jgi:hypothetical protein